MTFFTGVFGLPARKDLRPVIETEDGAPNGYDAPGIIFSRQGDGPDREYEAGG